MTTRETGTRQLVFPVRWRSLLFGVQRVGEEQGADGSHICKSTRSGRVTRLNPTSWTLCITLAQGDSRRARARSEHPLSRQCFLEHQDVLGAELNP